MNPNSSNVQKIKKLFEKEGVEKRKQGSMMAEILGIQYNSAKQKLDEKRSISIAEVKKIYSYFKNPLDGERKYNGVFIMNDLHVRCNVEVDADVAEHIEDGENYAEKNNDTYIVSSILNDKSKKLYKVMKIDFLPSPKLAILDNDADLLELLKVMCSKFGIETYTFQTNDELLDAMNNISFDCYIVDWLLDYEEDSLKVIKEIKKENENLTIILLTGQLNQHESEIANAIFKYGVEIIEKPTRPAILSSLLLADLFFKE